MSLILIAGGLAFLYLILQLFYLYHWLKIEPVIVPKEFIPSTAVSIIVVAHNEEKTIEKCLRGILSQRFPGSLFEIIVIDDRSNDKTESIIQNINSPQIRLLKLAEHPLFIHQKAFKKSAIELAVNHAYHDWIIVTDADCTHHPDWLKTIAYAKELTEPAFLTGPIEKKGRENFLGKMQEMENLAFMVVTAAGIRSGLHDIANGANMSFSKKAFLEINGFEGNYEYASGDDMFLIEKIRKYDNARVSFLKSPTAMVRTSTKTSWKSLIQQRLRWAGKNKGLNNPLINLIWGFVGLYHVTMVSSLILPLVTTVSLLPFIILFITKWIIDFILIQNASFFFHRRPFQGNTILLQFLYTFYVFRIGWNLLLGRKGDWQ